MRSRMVTATALFVAISSAGGCSSDDSAGDPTTTMIRLAPITAAPEIAVSTTVPVDTAPPSTTAAIPTPVAPTATDPVATTTTTTAAPPTTTPAAVALLLRDDGLGDATFGDDADQVIDYVTSVVGQPTYDSGWADPHETFGVCGGTEVRGVAWDDLQLLFGDVSGVASGRRHFFNYVYGPADRGPITPAGMHTATDIGIGTQVAALRAAYPSVQVYPEEIYGPYFVVNENLTGFLTGVTDTDTIISFIGGIGCGE